ncbi:MAG: hypothetical protein V7749_17675 [Cocleimonas sp.]|jgi:hypothetical protein
MGLIVGPLILFWILVGIYSLTIGYDVFSYYSFFPGGIVIGFVTLLLVNFYFVLPLEFLKKKKTLGAFEIPLMYLANKFAFMCFLAAILIHWYGSGFLSNDFFKPIPFIVMFTISFGGIMATVNADTFMEENNITKTF